MSENHFGPLVLAVSMIHHRLGPQDDVATPMSYSETQELVCYERVTRQFQKAYAQQRLEPGETLTDTQMRRLRVGLYRISIFLDRFQRLHFSPDVRRDFGIYAKWLMALSTDDLLELGDTRLLVAEVLR